MQMVLTSGQNFLFPKEGKINCFYTYHSDKLEAHAIHKEQHPEIFQKREGREAINLPQKVSCILLQMCSAYKFLAMWFRDLTKVSASTNFYEEGWRRKAIFRRILLSDKRRCQPESMCPEPLICWRKDISSWIFYCKDICSFSALWIAWS